MKLLLAYVALGAFTLILWAPVILVLGLIAWLFWDLLGITILWAIPVLFVFALVGYYIEGSVR